MALVTEPFRKIRGIFAQSFRQLMRFSPPKSRWRQSHLMCRSAQDPCAPLAFVRLVRCTLARSQGSSRDNAKAAADALIPLFRPFATAGNRNFPQSGAVRLGNRKHVAT